MIVQHRGHGGHGGGGAWRATGGCARYRDETFPRSSPVALRDRAVDLVPFCFSRVQEETYERAAVMISSTGAQ